jgi:AcrR family transcriptional regulator
MARDAAATRARILDAAVEEFAAYGLAGARIDRIAETADANKRSIYVYFQNKELLFNAALHHVIRQMTEAVPLTEHDLPGYAGLLYDYGLTHPQAFRMSMWRTLERPTAGPNETAIYAAKITAMRSRRSNVHASGLPPTDLLVLIHGLIWAWMISPEDLLSADGSDPQSPERIAAHRASLVEAARRVCTAQSSPAPKRKRAPETS